jgi:ribonuclease E
VLVEHYVSSAAASTLVGNVYLGKVQNVLPSMEAAFVDIGRGRNAVLYAGEVNWDAAGLVGQPKRIEHVLKSGDSVLVQVTKDPVGHKGARLTSNVSLAGRFLVYVPDGSMNGISRKLPDKERSRLKGILKGVVPDDAGVIVRTAAEGATEEQLTHDVERLKERWASIEKKAKTASAPNRLYGEPDLTVRVIRDLFNEDFEKLVVSGDEAWDTVQDYVGDVAPDLMDRVEKYVGAGDVFHDLRIDEQIAKALDRKVWLPSGGSLVIDRTEAMTVIDVNTGKFVGKGSGNLEETVTRNNLEAAEEIVRQLRLRDVGGIIVIDFIDMVLESNRELVLRRLTECLGRDRTKHQVAEVTSLGLVQMTRKRIGTGLLEAFSEPCEVCNGRGVKIQLEPVEAKSAAKAERSDHSERVARVHRASRSSKPADAVEGAPVEGVEPVETPEIVERMEHDAPVELAAAAEVIEPAEAAPAEPVPAKPRRRRATKAAGAPEPASVA